MGVKQRIKALQKAWNKPVTPATAKDVINSTLLIGESDRGGRHKGFIPNYLWKPPYGYPRHQNINEIRAFARTPHVWMAVDTIASEISQMDWDVRVKPEVVADMSKEEAKKVQASYSERIRHGISFFKNPNTNKEPLQDILYKVTTDMLEINAGVINKIFDLRSMAGGEPRMVEIVTRDGGTFLKNPDMHGMMTTRADIVPTPVLYENANGQVMNEGSTTPPTPLLTPGNQQATAANAAYFQYGYNVAMRAVPYGKRELIWLEKTPRTDTLYGPAPVEIALTIVKVLLYGTEDMLQYYVDNNVPKGAFSLKGANKEQMDAFKEQWFNQLHTTNNLDQQMRKYWQMPFTNREMEFVRFQFSPAELELINQQEWLSKLVWALCKVTPSELGFTENSNRATEYGQDRVHKRKALDPILSKIEYHFNSELMYEFGPEYQDLEFYFPEHDIQKEKAQTEVYSMQVKNGIKTVNEVREELGLESVEWGDNPPSGYNSSVEEDLEAAMNDPSRSDDLKSRIAQLIRSPNSNPPTRSSLDNQKALGTESVLILDEGERGPTEGAVEDIIEGMLENIRLTALAVYKEITGKKSRRTNPKELKTLGDKIKERLKAAAGLGAIKSTITAAIRKEFLEGHEEIEKSMNMNFQPDKKAMEFLETYTFDNVKGLAEDSVTKLRGVLERGLMDGKGSDAIAKDIEKALEVERPRAQAIARTEMTRARNAGVESTIKKNGVKGKFRWKASGNRNSDRATKLCTALDGQEVPVGQDFEGSAGRLSFKGPRPPAHVNCRSRLEFIPDFSEE